MKRIRLAVNKDCRYSTESLPGKGVRYLKTEPNTMPVRIGLAVGAVFGPMMGASQQEVDELIRKCRRICEDYWALARTQAEGIEDDSDQLELEECSDQTESSDNQFEAWDL